MPLSIRGAWYHKSFPDHVIAELPAGNFVTFRLAPFRDVREDELEAYNGHDPRLYGDAVPAYIWRFYGLAPAEA